MKKANVKFPPRGFIRVPRIMDDEPMYLRVTEISAVVQNADESGPVEGTAGIYMKGGLAVAANAAPGEVMDLIAAQEAVQ